MFSQSRLFCIVNFTILTLRCCCQDCHFSLWDVFLPLFSQSANWELFGFFVHKDPAFCRQLIGKFEEFLLSLIYGLAVILLMSSSSQSHCEQGDRSVLAALFSLQNAAPTSQRSVLALSEEGETGSLRRHCCSEIPHLSDSGATRLCSKASALHCANNHRQS